MLSLQSYRGLTNVFLGSIAEIMPKNMQTAASFDQGPVDQLVTN